MKELFIQRIEKKVLEHLQKKENQIIKESELNDVLDFILLIKEISD